METPYEKTNKGKGTSPPLYIHVSAHTHTEQTHTHTQNMSKPQLGNINLMRVVRNTS